MRSIRVLFFLLLFLSAQLLTAQQSNTLYFMHRVPQSSHLNPAFSTPCNYLGLPLISSFHADVGNTAFSYNQLFPVKGDGRIVDLNFLERSLHNLDLLNAQVHVDLFSLGMWYEDYFFSFNITEKADLFVSYPKNAFLVPWKGNTRYVGETAKIGRLGLNLSYYREYALSASTWVQSDLKLGVRAGLLFGKLNLNTRREALNLFTQENNYHLNLSGSYRVNSTFPIDVTEDSGGNITEVRLKEDISVKNILLNRKNPGISFDLGGIYTGLDRVTLYGSIDDLGLMYWSSDLNNATAEQSFRFNGVTREDLQSDDYAREMIDSLRGSYDIDLSHDPYLTVLPMKSYLGASYRFNPSLEAGALQRNLIYKWRIHPALILSLNMELLNFLSLSASYSYNKYSFNNFGVGLSLGEKNMQFYMVTDDLTAIRPTNTRNVNLRFGLNLFFGCKDQVARRPAEGSGSSTGCFWIKRQQENNRILPHKK